MNKQNLTSVCGWPDCPEPVRGRVNDILTFYKKLLGGNLLGFYLHGSLAMGCFNPESSDIDFLVVVRDKLTTPKKIEIISYLLKIDNDSAPSPEMSIVTQASLDNLAYPSPYELHYSKTWRERYRENKVDWEEPRYDADLVIFYMAIRHNGIRLYGRPAQAAFPEVPRDICIASLAEDMDWLRERIDTIPLEDIVLNPCRHLAFIREGTFVSKTEGGEWGLSHLPHEFADLIHQALAAYSGAEEVIQPETNTLVKFVDYVRNEFTRLSTKHDRLNT
jgi:predicted nucleotidyltransferase